MSLSTNPQIPTASRLKNEKNVYVFFVSDPGVKSSFKDARRLKMKARGELTVSRGRVNRYSFFRKRLRFFFYPLGGLRRYSRGLCRPKPTASGKAGDKPEASGTRGDGKGQGGTKGSNGMTNQTPGAAGL